MTVVAYDAGPGSDLSRAWQLALVQFLYFAGTVFYVKTVIRERDNPVYRWLSGGYHVVALLVVAAVFGLVADDTTATTTRATAWKIPLSQWNATLSRSRITVLT